MSESASRAVTVFTVFTPKSDKFSEFVDLQNTTLPTFRDKVPGLIGSRFYTSIDNKTAVLMSVWEKFSHFEQFRDSELFAQHRGKLQPLLVRSEPGVYELGYHAGNIGA
jgi:quinol monooxygenase YgiN